MMKISIATVASKVLQIPVLCNYGASHDGYTGTAFHDAVMGLPTMNDCIARIACI